MNFDQTMKAYYKERDHLGIGKQMKEISEHPQDICECGDYRRDHDGNGVCKLKGLGHGIPKEWYPGCFKFRLSMKAEECSGEQGVIVADANENARQ